MLELKHVEPGTYARSVVRAVGREYADLVPYMDGAVVLDIGAHVGAFTLMALNAGAKLVVCIEPGSPSVALLKQNIAPVIDRCKVIHAGVTHDPKVFKLTLRYLSHNRSMAGAKTWYKRSAPSWNGVPYVYEEVEAVYFQWLLKSFKPRVIKLDCEGPEYDCIESLKTMPRCVKAIAVEWHKTQGKNIQRYLSCTHRLWTWGFTPKREASVRYRYDKGRKIIGSNQFFIRPITYYR